MSDSPDLNHLNYTVLVPYNGTGDTGGDPRTQDLNVFYDVSGLLWRLDAVGLSN
jgi:Amt family ammonium transporter